MSDTVPFRKPRPEQLTRADLAKLTPEEIERARQGGHLEDLLAGKKPPPPDPPPAPPRSGGS
jgi:hypothetical protein